MRTWRARSPHLLRVSVERQTSFVELHVEFSVGEAGGKEPVVDGTVTPSGLAQAGRANRERTEMREQENLKGGKGGRPSARFHTDKITRVLMISLNQNAEMAENE